MQGQTENKENSYFPKIDESVVMVGKCATCGYEADESEFKVEYGIFAELGLDCVCPKCRSKEIGYIKRKK